MKKLSDILASGVWVKSLESPAKAGLACRLARLFAGLARKAWPGTVWPEWSSTGFCGSPGHKSMAFLAKQQTMPGFPGLPGRVKKKIQIPGIPCHPLLTTILWTIKNVIVRQEFKLLLGCFWQSCWEFKEHRQVVTSHHTVTILKKKTNNNKLFIINIHSCMTGHFGFRVMRYNSVSYGYYSIKYSDSLFWTCLLPYNKHVNITRNRLTV